MAHITTDVKMEVILISKKPMNQPDWLSLDFTTVKLPSGKEIYFDFKETDGTAELLENGHCELQVTKQNFDTQYFLSSDNGQKVADLDWDKMLHWEFVELYMIGDSVVGANEDININDFIVKSIKFTDIKDNEPITYEATQKQLDILNESIEKMYNK